MMKKRKPVGQLFTMRMDSDTRHYLRYLAKQYGITSAGVIRMMIQREVRVLTRRER